MAVSSLGVMLFGFPFTSVSLGWGPGEEWSVSLFSIALFERSGNVPARWLGRQSPLACLADDLTNGRRWQPWRLWCKSFQNYWLFYLDNAWFSLWISRRIPSYLYCEQIYESPWQEKTKRDCIILLGGITFYGRQEAKADRSRPLGGNSLCGAAASLDHNNFH